MLNLKRTNLNLDSKARWEVAIDSSYVPDSDCMLHFDQNGYDLCPLERQYAAANLSATESVRWRHAVKKAWFTGNMLGSVHVNHADLYERKGYHGAALEQICCYAETIPVIYKLVHLRPKWGIDISIDYVDAHCAYEVFHYEWDDFDFNRVVHKQAEIEQLILSTDWVDFADQLWRMRDQWAHLDFVGQARFKTDYLGIEPERFKLVAWD